MVSICNVIWFQTSKEKKNHKCHIFLCWIINIQCKKFLILVWTSQQRFACRKCFHWIAGWAGLHLYLMCMLGSKEYKQMSWRNQLQAKILKPLTNIWGKATQSIFLVKKSEMITNRALCTEEQTKSNPISSLFNF